MENKKQKLIKNLQIAITALKNDTIHYEWHEQCSCNCGVVSQAVLGKNRDELIQDLKPMLTGIGKYNLNRKKQKL